MKKKDEPVTPPQSSEGSEYAPPPAKHALLRETALDFGTHEALRKKNYRLRQSIIDRAMKVLGTRTETETIEQALDLVVFRSELISGVRAMRGAALQDVFGSEPA